MTASVAQIGGAVKVPGKRNAPRATVKEIGDVVRVWDRTNTAAFAKGKPLAQRVLESYDCYGFLFEFEADHDELVYGCYNVAENGLDSTQPEYALSVVGGVVVSCNCPDAQCRKRLCKHKVWLALEGGFALTLPSPLPRVAMAVTLAQPPARERMAA